MWHEPNHFGVGWGGKRLVAAKKNVGPRTLDPHLSLSLQGQKKSETKKGENLPSQGAKNFRKEHCREGGYGFFLL